MHYFSDPKEKIMEGKVRTELHMVKKKKCWECRILLPFFPDFNVQLLLCKYLCTTMFTTASLPIMNFSNSDIYN